MTAHVRWIMLMAGLLTFTMVYAALAPQAALQKTFGATLEGPLAEIIVRNWGTLIALIGVMLIYGAYRPAVRALVLVIAGVSKIVFIALVLAFGPEHLTQPLVVSIAVDAVLVVLFIGCLVSLRRERIGA
jgi:hypothetical protein